MASISSTISSISSYYSYTAAVVVCTKEKLPGNIEILMESKGNPEFIKKEFISLNNCSVCLYIKFEVYMYMNV